MLVNSLVNPCVPIPLAASAIHGITDADVADSPHFIDLWPRVWATLHGAERILMYNGSYDSRLIRQFLDGDAGALAQVDTLRYGCIMQLYARFYGAFNEYRGSYTWHKLGQAVNQCSLTMNGKAHRALADTPRNPGCPELQGGVAGGLGRRCVASFITRNDYDRASRH